MKVPQASVIAFALLGGSVLSQTTEYDQQDNTWDENSSTITNDVTWTDKAGDKIKANRAATISKKKFDGYWYLVGSASKPALQECKDYTDKTAGNIYIYKSKNLGSNSWEEVALIPELTTVDGDKKHMEAFGCAMHQHPTSARFYLHCRTIVCVTKSNSPQDFSKEGSYGCRQQLKFPVDPDDTSKRRGGDGRVSFRKDDDLYYVTIRAQEPGNRKLYIYKLNKEWDQIEEITASRIYDKRESPEIVEHNNQFYLFTSQNKRWEWSTTHYLRSDTLEGLGLSTKEEKVLPTILSNGSNKNTFASQFSFIQNFGTITNPQYMLSGRRHPVEDPCFMAKKWGSIIMTPFKFNEAGEPAVYWKKSFDWKSKKDFDWESDDNETDSFPKNKQHFKPVCDATDDELFCKYNPNPNPNTCRDEHKKKNLECKLAPPTTEVPSAAPTTSAPTKVAPTTSAPTTMAPTSLAPTTAVVCKGLSKNKCNKNDACAFGPRNLKNCRPKEGAEHECSQYLQNLCNQKSFCKYELGACIHECDGLSKTTCKKKKKTDTKWKICRFIKETNPCHKCNPITCS